MANAHTRQPFHGKQLSDFGLQELHGSPLEQYSHHQGQVTRRFRMSWRWRWDAVAYLLGHAAPVYSNTGAFLTIKRELPDVYKPTVAVVKTKHKGGAPQKDDWGNVLHAGSLEEDEKERPWLWAADLVSMKGVGRQSKVTLPDGSSFSSYDEAHAEIAYAVRHYRLVEDAELLTHGYSRVVGGRHYPDEYYAARYCSFHPQPSVLHTTVPQDGMTWAAGSVGGLAGKRGYGNTSRLKHGTDVQLRWYGVPGLPDGLHTLLGTVNDRAWEIHPPGRVQRFAPHTLLYLGFRLHTYRQVTGTFAHDVSYLFSHFPEGQGTELAFPPGENYRWTRVVSAAYDDANDGYLDKGLYPEADWSALFRLPALT